MIPQPLSFQRISYPYKIVGNVKRSKLTRIQNPSHFVKTPNSDAAHTLNMPYSARLDLRPGGGSATLGNEPLLVEVTEFRDPTRPKTLPATNAGEGGGIYGGKDSDGFVVVFDGRLASSPPSPLAEATLVNEGCRESRPPTCACSPDSPLVRSICSCISYSSSSVRFRPTPKLISPSFACMVYPGSPSSGCPGRQTPPSRLRRDLRGVAAAGVGSLMMRLRANVGYRPCFLR